MVRCADYLASLLNQLAPEIEHFDCLREIARAKAIVMDGPSADFQLASVSETEGDGVRAPATPAVVDWIARVTAG